MRERTLFAILRWRIGNDTGMVVFLNMRRSITTRSRIARFVSLYFLVRPHAQFEGTRATA
jgi:hypothetical protein